MAGSSGSGGSKVAKAAAAGKRTRVAKQRSLLFPVSLAVVMVLGLSLVVYARSTREVSAAPRAGVGGDHWHSAYGIYVCDAFVSVLPVNPTGTDDYGIHTHGDGVIHVHPFLSAASGTNARMKLFLETEGVELRDDELVLPDHAAIEQKTYAEGTEPGCGGQEAELVLARWGTTDSNEPDLIREDFGDVRFRADGEVFTIAYVAAGTEDIPKPPQEQLDLLDLLSANPEGEPLPAPGGTVPLGPDATTTTTAPAGEGGTTTTGPAGPTTTAAADATTTTSG